MFEKPKPIVILDLTVNKENIKNFICRHSTVDEIKNATHIHLFRKLSPHCSEVRALVSASGQGGKKNNNNSAEAQQNKTCTHTHKHTLDSTLVLLSNILRKHILWIFLIISWSKHDISQLQSIKMLLICSYFKSKWTLKCFDSRAHVRYSLYF